MIGQFKSPAEFPSRPNLFKKCSTRSLGIYYSCCNILDSKNKWAKIESAFDWSLKSQGLPDFDHFLKNGVSKIWHLIGSIKQNLQQIISWEKMKDGLLLVFFLKKISQNSHVGSLLIIIFLWHTQPEPISIFWKKKNL